MTSPSPSERRLNSKAQQAMASLTELLTETSERGYYGTASLSVSIQDGHIQHVKVATERMLK